MIPQEARKWARPLGVGAMLLLAVAWIASGILTREAPAPAEERAAQPPTVAVATRQAEPVEQILILHGRVEPHMRIQVRAETAGQVAQWHARQGDRVGEGDRLVELRMEDREARRQQAIARLRDAQSERDATAELVERGVAARIELEAREAAVAAARAELETIELDIDNTRIRSPVAGVLNERIAERGHYVGMGERVAEIVDNDPLLGVVHVPQHQVRRVERGQRAHLRFLDGQRAEGEVTFISAVAEPGTRTFRIEVEVPNPDYELSSGVSAGIEIPTRTVDAHKISPAVISLDGQGRVGVKTVDDDDRVVFHPIQVVRTAPDGVWVTGLPETIRLITVGQGFVSDGQVVRPQPVAAGNGPR